jgi:hypothetical protein
VCVYILYSICVYICVCVLCIYMCVCVYIYMCVCVYLHVCVCVCVFPMSLRINSGHSRTQHYPIGLCILRSGDFCAARNEDKVLGTVTALRDGRSKNLGANSGRGKKMYLFSRTTRPALGSTQLPVQ